MRNGRKISIEPDSYGLKGFELEELLSEKFLKLLKAEFPQIQIQHMVFDVVSPEESILLGYNRKQEKNIRDKVIADATDASLLPKVLEIVKKCFE